MLPKILIFVCCLSWVQTAFANCFSCCSNPSDIQFCISSDGKDCTGGCDCCPSASQIGQNPDNTYFCCKEDTPQVTSILGKDGYQMCCKDGAVAFSNDGINGQCCDGEVYKNKEEKYVCCSGSTPQATSVNDWDDKICCAKGDTAYTNLNGSHLCCSGTPYCYETRDGGCEGWSHLTTNLCCPKGGNIFEFKTGENDTSPIRVCCPEGTSLYPHNLNPADPNPYPGYGGTYTCCAQPIKKCCNDMYCGECVGWEWTCGENACPTPGQYCPD